MTRQCESSRSWPPARRDFLKTSAVGAAALGGLSPAHTVGADPENRVMILTTTGDTWIANIDDSSFSKEEDDRPYYSYEHMY